MTRTEKDNINKRTENRRLLRRIKAGFVAMKSTPYKGLLLALLGTPWCGRAAKEGLQKAGLTNHAGEAPVLIAKRPDADKPRLTVWEFGPCGIPLGEWEDKRAGVETALNLTIAKMT